MPHLLVLDLSFNEFKSASPLPRADKLKVRAVTRLCETEYETGHRPDDRVITCPFSA